MKKVYLKPSMEIEEVGMQTIIAASDIQAGEGGTSNNGIIDAQSKPRGTWGDLWYENQ